MRKIFTTIIIIVFSVCLMAQNGKNVTVGWLKDNYTKREVMIPMRDGARLYTAVYEPVSEAKAKPVMLVRTPYSLKPYGFEAGEEPPKDKQTYSSGIRDDLLNYAADGYVIVFQNVRGTFLSDGNFENIRPHLSDKTGGRTKRSMVDEATDTYDTVEWILTNTRCNGSVGVKGTSYPGFYATMAALSRHPAIKAVSPQAPVTDWFMGDDAHHNGALCLADCYRFGSSMYRTRKAPSTKGLSKLVKIDTDLYEYFRGIPMSGLSNFFGDTLTFWNSMVAHPDYDYFAAGPWYHGGWNNRKANHLAGAWFAEESGSYYLDNIEYPFFTYYLEGKGNASAKVNVLPSCETIRCKMEGVQSAARWETYSSWPPSDAQPAKIFLSGTDSLNMSGQPDTMVFRTFTSDPANPVPYMDVKSSGRDRGYMAADQSFASARGDVLTYSGRVLSDTLHLAGPVMAHIELRLDLPDGSKSRNMDADIVVKLIDVRPDGYQMLVRGDVMPVRYRDGFGKSKALKSGKVVSVDFTMCDIDHYFLPGHALMIQIQGSWFPLIAMNPQTFVRNPFSATKEDYRPISISVSSYSYIECGKVNIHKQ